MKKLGMAPRLAVMLPDSDMPLTAALPESSGIAQTVGVSRPFAWRRPQADSLQAAWPGRMSRAAVNRERCQMAWQRFDRLLDRVLLRSASRRLRSRMTSV